MVMEPQLILTENISLVKQKPETYYWFLILDILVISIILNILALNLTSNLKKIQDLFYRAKYHSPHMINIPKNSQNNSKP